VLEEKVVVRVGGSTPIHTDTRVLAATNQDLAAMVRSKKFREDLYFRLNVVSLDLPPLRERGDDVVLLAEHFLADFAKRARRKTPKFSAEARRRLVAHSWPGNVRELRKGDRIEADELAFILAPSKATASELLLDLPLNEATERFQVDYIHKSIARVKGNVSEAAKLLGLHRSNLYRKMRQLGMETPE
jgi:Nif-specific regulatory protein